ncbi:helix-turn-helix domain-containing protein [Demequina flava]|uniref:helix-turn-helix domain-containing protein n=1 Tax=Demequina flava TaxID=1095025 RepID=UPI0034E2EC74
MTVEELANLCRTSPNTVHWWIAQGTAPLSQKIGRRRLFPVEEVERWLAAQPSDSGVRA